GEKGGSLLAGTDPSGLVLRIASNGKQFAVLDSPTQEIHSIATTPDGSIYALGVSQTSAASSTRASSVGVSTSSALSSDGTITITAGDEQESTTTPEAAPAPAPKSKAEGARSALFRINPDGTNDVLWRANDSMGYSISPASDGSRILVGTNNRGRIYEVASDHSRSLLVQSP